VENWDSIGAVIDRSRERLYLEGLEVFRDTLTDRLWAFDRSGVIYWQKVSEINAGSVGPWHRYDLGSLVGHGQDIGWGRFGGEIGLWFAAEDHFRFVSAKLFTDTFQNWNAVLLFRMRHPWVRWGLLASAIAALLGLARDLYTAIRRLRERALTSPRRPVSEIDTA
jgi:hypothetical protein